MRTRAVLQLKRGVCEMQNGRSRPVGSRLWLFFILPSAFCLLSSAFGLRAWGQTYSIDWYKIAGGGGTSTGGT